MRTISEYNITLSTYHDEFVARLSFEDQESNLYSLVELCNIIELWKMGALCGSFAIGTILSDKASFTMKGTK